MVAVEVVSAVLMAGRVWSSRECVRFNSAVSSVCDLGHSR